MKISEENIREFMIQTFTTYASTFTTHGLLRFQINLNGQFRVILNRDILYFGSFMDEAIKLYNFYEDSSVA